MKNTHPLLLLVVALPLAAGAAGCKQEAAPPPADPASAEVDPGNATDVGPTVATDPLPPPPEPKVEEFGTAPSDHHVWIDGYWWFDHPRHEYVWSPGFWQDRLIVASVPPPALIYEYPGRAPSNEYVYIPGYWIWRGTEYVWYHGYWGYHRDGWTYVHPYWEAVGGHWHCSGWGWERYTPGWEVHHAGWAFHAGVWERPAEFQARVTLARAHAADYRVTPGTWHGHIVGRADANIHLQANATVHPGETVHEPERPARHAEPRPAETHHPAEARPAETHHPAEGHPAEVRRPGETHPQGHPHYDTHPAEEHQHHPGEHH